MRVVSEIKSEWLVEIAPHFYSKKDILVSETTSYFRGFREMASSTILTLDYACIYRRMDIYLHQTV